MRHRKHRGKLSRPTGHRNALLRNMAVAIIEHGRIHTTAAKAKVLRPYVEKIITLGRKGTLHHRRMAFSMLQDKKATHKVFETIAPIFKDRDGGYTRIVLAGFRHGDGAEMAYFEFIEPINPVEESEGSEVEESEKEAEANA